jgi:DNA polymerase-3 subunit alpha (Gram-positive type)
MHRNIEEVEFTIFDTETTGLDPDSGDRIIEIAGIRFSGNARRSVFISLVNPGRAVSEAAFAVNRITPDMLVNAPKIEEVLPQFLDFVQGSCLCSYNAPFDLGFLNNELKIMGRDFPKEIVVVDILVMARRLLPNLERHALSFVSESLGLRKEQQHRALADVELTLEVFNRLFEVLKKKGIIDFKNFVGLFGFNLHLLEDLRNQKTAKIQEAIDSGLKLKIKYLSRSNLEVSAREVIPKEIKQQKGYSYLVGFCCLRNEERTFRIDSMLDLEIIK